MKLGPSVESTKTQASQESSKLAAEDVEDDEVDGRVDGDEEVGDGRVSLDPLDVFVHED